MQFEDLQAIWDTQTERPVFAINDSRLAVGLYQQRERSRRRLFREQIAPLYFGAWMVAAFSAFLFLVFFVKTISKMRLTDPLMTVWDGAALLIALAAAVSVAVPMYSERRKHEREQNVFAPSLREELDRGISQLDFELNFHSTRRMCKSFAMVFIGGVVMLWETGRLNGDPAPWSALPVILICMIASSWYAFAARNKIVEQVTQRKRALESMRSELSRTDGRIDERGY
jgi:hypothetical protein